MLSKLLWPQTLASVQEMLSKEAKIVNKMLMARFEALQGNMALGAVEDPAARAILLDLSKAETAAGIVKHRVAAKIDKV
ncbi:hypothetical protein CBOM_05720 [Ceraceosorus bombacis]|uniref:Uncharacterized protein n=1 Tax=Ceraceosorus bombacis TaxID=401625 RepID=A0A0P1BRJ5_9BASI|nr:hypothetical protein CBOM_05720 [Ceraceosorus bombacis]